MSQNGKEYNRFTIGMYHVNTMEIIELFSINIFMPVTNFPCLTILLFFKRKSLRVFGLFKGFFKKQKLGILR